MSTTQTAVRPFQVNIPQEDLDDLRRRTASRRASMRMQSSTGTEA